MSGTFGRIATVLLIAALFYVGSGLRHAGRPALPSMAAPAFANVSVGTDKVETVITSSDDGQTIYVWRYFGAKPPRYLGMARATPEQ